jgi:hypothetical protein
MGRIRSRLSYANVASSFALFMAVTGGTAIALSGTNSVDSGDIRNGQVKPADLARFPAARVGNSASQNVPNDDSSYRLPFNTEQFDNANLHRSATPRRLYAPIDGVYVLTTSVVWDDSGGTPQHSITLRKNGTKQLAITDDDKSQTTAPGQTLSTIAKLKQGDYVEVWVYLNSNALTPRIQSLPPLSPSFAMAWIGRG